MLCSDEKMSVAISITIFLSVIFGLGSPYVTGWYTLYDTYISENVAALMQTKFNILKKSYINIVPTIFIQVF